MTNIEITRKEAFSSRLSLNSCGSKAKPPVLHSPQRGLSLRRAYTSGSVAENSGSAWQGAKISASADILAPTELHLVHNSINTTSG